jgi:hypothetical protein
LKTARKPVSLRDLAGAVENKLRGASQQVSAVVRDLIEKGKVGFNATSQTYWAIAG